MKSPHNPLLTGLKVRLIAAMLLLAVILPGCSTLPATTPLLLPPPGAMEKAQPLPKLPEGASVADLIDNDLQVVGLYHELAKRHAKLVDYVDSLITKQAAE